VDMIKQVTMAQAASASNAVGDEKDMDPKPHRSSPPASPVLGTDSPTVPTTAPKFSFKPPPIVNANGADYESITLMRMRKIAKEKLEKEIREQEIRSQEETPI